jgi:hypothetical protein
MLHTLKQERAVYLLYTFPVDTSLFVQLENSDAVLGPTRKADRDWLPEIIYNVELDSETRVARTANEKRPATEL